MNWIWIADLMIYSGVVMLLIWFVLSRITIMDVDTAMLVMNLLNNSKRPLREGLNWIWPWEKKIEKSKTEIVASSYSFVGNFAAKNGAILSFKISFIRKPSAKHLERYIEIDEETRTAAIVERIRAITSIKVQKYAGRAKVMADLKNLADSIETEFEEEESEEKKGESKNKSSLLEEYYGEDISQLGIAGVEPPKTLQEAQARLEAQAKENEAFTSQMNNLDAIALSMVAKSDGSLTFEKAIKRAQVQSGKIKEDIKTFDLGPGAQSAVSGLGGGIAGFGKILTDLASKHKEGDENGK